MSKKLTKNQILDAYSKTRVKREIINILNTTNYYFNMALKEFDIKLEYTSPSPYTMDYWLSRGYSESDAIHEIKIRRIYNKEYWIHKYGDVDGSKKYYEFITKGTKGIKQSESRRIKNNTTIEYWINKGYSPEIAKLKVKERQNTGSIQSYINRHGDILGTELFNERQKKWQTTLNSKSNAEIDLINYKKDSSSVKYFKNKYGNDWKIKYIDRNTRKNSEFRNILIRCSEYDTLADVISNIVYISPKYTILNRLLRSTFFLSNYNVNVNDVDNIHSEMISKYDIDNYIKHQYGTKIKYKNVFYTSHGEFIIAKFLTENFINFSYDKKYKNSNYRYDFYIEPIDLYVEYAGMKGVDFYDTKLTKKLKHTETIGISVLVSDDVDYVINEIQKRINEK